MIPRIRTGTSRRRLGLVSSLVVGLITACDGANTATGPGGDQSLPPGGGGGGASRVAVPAMGSATYLGFTGGLYPSGNTVPSVHDSVGRAEAKRIIPRAADGTPSPSGKIVLISIGMSNTTQEFCGGASSCNSWTFMGQAAADASVNKTTLVIADGAAGGQTAGTWDQSTDANYNRVRDNVLPGRGVTEAQVQVAWVKVANAQPTVSLPNSSADAYTLVRQIGDIARALRARYPNLRQIFHSSRTYGEFATTSLNPEPYAYESGFGVKWAIQAQIDQGKAGPPDVRAGDLRYDTAPWLAWGPYLWGGPTNTGAGDLVWVRDDFVADGTHPSMSGQQKVGTRLLSFFKGSPYTACWFLAGGQC